MGMRTQLFKMIPWQGGLHTSVEISEVQPNELVQAENILFAESGSRHIREGINQDWDDQSNSTESIIGLHDFWYGSASRTNKRIAVTDGKKVYPYSSSGVRSADIFTGTAWSNSITKVSMVTFNNTCIIAVDGDSNVMKKYDGTTFADLGGTPPVASICREHLGRLWTNDKTNLDRLHYSTTANAEQWNGSGDSGALDIGVGDGDPDGITAIFPTFKGILFVAKRTKLYKVVGYTPEEFQVILVSSGIGCPSHNSIALIDQDDMFFVSERGVHSIAATDTYGDFQATYLSSPIQKDFNDRATKSRLKYVWGAYASNINSYAIALTDDNYSATENKAIWLYNIPLKSWYYWPNISCQSLITASDSDQKRFYIGSNVTRVYKTLTGLRYDQNTSGTDTSIPMRVKTGMIYPDGNPYTMKAFRKFCLFYKPRGTHTITVSLKVDNHAAQSLSFSDTSGADTLGVSFTLGTSTLGSQSVPGAYTFPIEGYGRGIQITITQTGVLSQADVDIQGFAIEWEPAEAQQLVITNAAST